MVAELLILETTISFILKRFVNNMSDKVYEEILKELEMSYSQGEIEESSYQELKQRYTRKMEENSNIENEPTTIITYKSLGGHSVSDETIKFSGAARLPGGIMPRFVKVSGSCKIKDDIEVNGIKCSGLLRSAGSIVSHGDIQVSGAFKSKKNVSATGDVNVSGAARVKGDLDTTGAIKISGAMIVNGGITGKEGVRVSGRARTDGNLYSENDIEVKGSVKVSGSVIGDNIKFKASHEFRRFLRSLWRSKVEGNITGSGEVSVDNIHVDGNVRGKVVRIGHNSRIEGKVQYTDNIFIEHDVFLREQPERISLEGRPIPVPHRTPVQKFPSISSNGVPAFCSNCGEEVGKGKKFCPACGSNL